MGIFKKTEDVDPTKPLDEKSGSTPAGEKVQTESVAEDQESVEAPEDKGIFNCTPCKGSGLIGDPSDPRSTVCIACQGTGKVN